MPKATALIVEYGNTVTVEDNQIFWTNYCDIKTWFKSYEEELIKQGVAIQMNNRKIIINDDQLSHITNLDETAMFLR